VTRNIKDEALEHVSYTYNNLPINQVSPQNCNAQCDYTYTGSSGKQGVKLELSYILWELLTALHMT
jgi:hypothetical protein